MIIGPQRVKISKTKSANNDDHYQLTNGKRSLKLHVAMRLKKMILSTFCQFFEFEIN